MQSARGIITPRAHHNPIYITDVGSDQSRWWYILYAVIRCVQSRQRGSNNRDNASPRSLFTFPLVILIVLVLVRGTVTNSSTAPGALAPSSLANRVVVLLRGLALRDDAARLARDGNPSNTSSCNGARVTTPYDRAPEPSRTRETRSESSPSTTSSPPRDARAVVDVLSLHIRGNVTVLCAPLLCAVGARARASRACAAVQAMGVVMMVVCVGFASEGARERRRVRRRTSGDVGWFEKVTAHRAHFLAGKPRGFLSLVVIGRLGDTGKISTAGAFWDWCAARARFARIYYLWVRVINSAHRRRRRRRRRRR